MELAINSREMDGALVLRLEGTLDSTTTPSLTESFAAARAGKKVWVVIDFTDTDYVSSAGWGLLLAESEDLRKDGGALLLCSMQGHVQAAFRMMDVAKIVRAHEGLAEAFKELKNLRASK